MTKCVWLDASMSVCPRNQVYISASMKVKILLHEVQSYHKSICPFYFCKGPISAWPLSRPVRRRPFQLQRWGKLQMIHKIHLTLSYIIISLLNLLCLRFHSTKISNISMLLCNVCIYESATILLFSKTTWKNNSDLKKHAESFVNACFVDGYKMKSKWVESSSRHETQLSEASDSGYSESTRNLLLSRI